MTPSFITWIGAVIFLAAAWFVAIKFGIALALVALPQ